MFCPSCGAEYAIELNYCNRCGANLTSVMTPPSAPISIDVTKAVAAIGTTLAVITLGGFGAVIFGAVQLAKHTPMGTDPIMAMIMMGLLSIVIADILLIRQLSRLISASLSSGKTQQLKRPIAPALISNSAVPESPRPITARLAPGASVTENTTRFFEPVYRAPSEPK
jgi:hypothetical protein